MLLIQGHCTIRLHQMCWRIVEVFNLYSKMFYTFQYVFYFVSLYVYSLQSIHHQYILMMYTPLLGDILMCILCTERHTSEDIIDDVYSLQRDKIFCLSVRSILLIIEVNMSPYRSIHNKTFDCLSVRSIHHQICHI